MHMCLRVCACACACVVSACTCARTRGCEARGGTTVTSSMSSSEGSMISFARSLQCGKVRGVCVCCVCARVVCVH